MARLVCPKCDRRIPGDAIGPEAVWCPFCGWQGGRVSLDESPPGDDEQTTPSDTVEPGVEPVPPSPPEEVVRLAPWEVLRLALWSGFYVTTLIAALAAAVFAALGMCFLFAAAGLLAGLPALPRAVALFFGFSWCFCSLVCFPLMFCQAIRGRRRTIRVADGRLIVEVGRSKTELDLKDCGWMAQTWACDGKIFFFPRWLLIVVGAGREWFVCGFTEDKRREWERFLTAAGVRQVPSVRWRRILVALLLGAVLGGTLGAGAGQIAAAFGAVPMLVAMIAFLGSFDGAIAVLMYFGYVQWWHGQVGRGGFVALTAVLFAGLGFQLGLEDGFRLGLAGALQAALTVGACNAVIGAIAAWCAHALATRQRAARDFASVTPVGYHRGPSTRSPANKEPPE